MKDQIKKVFRKIIKETPSKLSTKALKRAKRKIKNPINKVSKQYSFHSIRHNVSTNFQRAKVDESISARLVGHSTVGATMTYGYYSEGIELKEAKEAVDKLPTL